MTRDSGKPAPPPVLILVPVFRDLQVTRDCLESLIGSDLPENASIAVINDNSPEAELRDYCQSLANRTGLKLVVNETNLGFVRSANLGFALDPHADILLLNSDTMVFGDWLQRLQSCAYRRGDTGTVTPFSNNGTICSYPVFHLSNDLPNHWTAAKLDEAFQQANASICLELPTAVGFCMYIKRSCLDETGPFDEENFGRGYGEECDFSLRASSLGWRHVVAADVFVYHKGGASFISETAERKRQADKVMHTLHPNYHRLVSDFLQEDSLYNARRNVDAIRLKDKPSDSASILEEHYRYAQTIQERTSEIQHALLEEQQQRKNIELMLGECREKFAETDRGLKEAQGIVSSLNKDMENAQIYAGQLMNHINSLKDQIYSQSDHISNMERSRSWRYTKWLRRK